MMNNKLQKASFGDFPLLVNSESRSGGKKTVDHEYPDSDKRFVEEFGKMPPIFTMEFWIHGSDSINQRLAFERVLETPGFQTLVHPVYGPGEVKSTVFSVSSSQKKLGLFIFNVTFKKSAVNITPSSSATTNSQVSAAADSAVAELDNVLEEKWMVPKLSNSINAAAEKVQEISSTLNATVTSVISPIQENVAAFSRVVNNTTNGAFSIIRKGESLKTTIETLYGTFLDIAQFPEDLLNGFLSLIDFSSDEASLPTNTVRRQEVANNNNLLNSHTKLTGLIRSYEASVYKDFNTQEEIDEIRDILNDKYNEIVLVNGDNIITQEVRSKINTLKTDVADLLNEKEQNSWKIIDTSLYKSSLSLICFQYYGDLDNLSILQNLNSDLNHSLLRDNIQLVTK